MLACKVGLESIVLVRAVWDDKKERERERVKKKRRGRKSKNTFFFTWEFLSTYLFFFSAKKFSVQIN